MGLFSQMAGGQVDTLDDALDILVKRRQTIPPEEVEEAAAELQIALQFLATMPGPMGALMRMELRKILGNLFRDNDDLENALAAYEQAEAEEVDLNKPEARNEKANVFSERSTTLLAIGDAAAAMSELEQALELRKDLPFAEQILYRWGLATDLDRRGEILLIMGREEEALDSYSRAIEEFEQLEDSPGVRWRKAVALTGKGLVLENSQAEQAQECFSKAIEILQNEEGETVMIDRCTAKFYRGDDAAEIIREIEGMERRIPKAAALTMRARLALVEEAMQSGEQEQLERASDWIDDGMELSRGWAAIGFYGLHELARELFSLGLQFYRSSQPQFIAEFIQECLDPEVSQGVPFGDSDFYQSAIAEIEQALEESRQRSQDTDRAVREGILQEGLRRAKERMALLLQSGEQENDSV